MSSTNIALLRDSIISNSSREIYLNRNTVFFLWLLKNRSELVTETAFRRFGSTISPQHDEVKAFLRDKSTGCPIKLIDLSAETIMEFIISLKKKDGIPIGYGQSNTTRTSIRHLFREYDVPYPALLAEQLGNFFKGLKRHMASDTQSGITELKIGKDPFEFSFYKILAKTLVTKDSKDFAFAHCALVLSWNLMCRVSNGLGIKFGHLEWENDSMVIYYGQMKNDQFGEKRDPKHIFANPIMPEICPILAVGIYLMSSDLGNSPKDSLFPGSKQYDRYRKIMDKLFEAPTVAQEMIARGITSKELGTHSTRKGAATYVCAGSTAGPNWHPVALRAGWSMPGVQSTYIKYDRAGDQYVGRTVCGLPLGKPDFAIVPPFFDGSRELVATAVTECFPDICPSTMRIGEMCLASLVYHAEWMKENFQTSHFLFSTPLFTQGIAKKLNNIVHCHIMTGNDPFAITGIPPHISILVEMQGMRDEVRRVVPRIESAVPEVVQGVTNVLEERAIGAGTVTTHGLKEMMKTVMGDVLGEAGVPEVLEFARNRDQAANAQPPLPNWGDRPILPPEFSFPKQPPLTLWQLWCCGNTSLKYPPYRNLRPTDMPNTNLKKRLCDLNWLMKKIEGILKQKGTYIEYCTLIQANEMYKSVQDQIELPEFTPEKRKRRKEQIGWNYIANKLRKMSH
jgi:hypothetical protein